MVLKGGFVSEGVYVFASHRPGFGLDTRVSSSMPSIASIDTVPT